MIKRYLVAAVLLSSTATALLTTAALAFSDKALALSSAPTSAAMAQEVKADLSPLATHKSANRVITLAPHVTEMVFAAGAGDKVVATVSSSNYPPEAVKIPRVGDGLSINAEQLLTLEPDLIVGWQNTLAIQKLMPMLTKLGISVMYSEPRTLDDIPASIEQLGKAMGTPGTADAQASDLREQLATLRSTYAGRAPVSVFIEIGTGPLYTLGDDTLTNDAIAACGGVNVFGDSALVAPAVTIESVLARNPDVVIIANRSEDRVAQRADYWQRLHLSAARQHHVYGIDPDMLVRPGPRLFQATKELCDYLDRARNSNPGQGSQINVER